MERDEFAKFTDTLKRAGFLSYSREGMFMDNAHTYMLIDRNCDYMDEQNNISRLEKAGIDEDTRIKIPPLPLEKYKEFRVNFGDLRKYMRSGDFFITGSLSDYNFIAAYEDDNDHPEANVYVISGICESEWIAHYDATITKDIAYFLSAYVRPVDMIRISSLEEHPLIIDTDRFRFIVAPRMFNDYSDRKKMSEVIRSVLSSVNQISMFESEE